MTTHRRTANLGMCAAAAVMVSSLGVLIAGGADVNAPGVDNQKSVDSTPTPQQHDAAHGYSVSMNARKIKNLQQP